MLERVHWHFEYDLYDAKALEEQHRQLLQLAREAFQNAYAPYSNFRVGAAALLSNGERVIGSNKENASFPAGTCAERVALHSAMDRFPIQMVVALAILAESPTAGFFSPCGICRQVMVELEQHQDQDITVILEQGNGKVAVFKRASDLLPLAFSLSR